MNSWVRVALAVAVLAAVLVPSAQSAEWFVSPHGQSDASGTQAQPWDLATALSHPPQVKPGDTIFLLGGRYFITRPLSKLRGTEEAPIRVRPFPGERVIVDPSSLILSLTNLFDDGAWTTFEDFGLVKIYGADEFGVAAERIISDTAPRRIRQGDQWGTETTPAVVCKGGDEPLTLEFKDLPVGLYYVSLYGRVAKYNNIISAYDLRAGKKFSADTVPQIMRPLYVHMNIADGPNGEVNDYRMRVAYRDNYEEVTRLYFNVFRRGDYTAKIYVGAPSLEELTIKRVELRSALAGCVWEPIKRDHYLFTDAEREAIRKNAPPVAKTVRTPAERAALDERIWNASPPLNTQHQDSPAGHWYHFCTPPEGEKEDAPWSIRKSPDGLPTPWVIENKKLGLTYTMDDYKAHKPLPEPYPWPDDGGGYYFPDKQTWYFPIAKLMCSQMGICNPGGLAETYHKTGDLEAARNGAMMLVRYATQYPALRMVFQELRLSTAVPDAEFTWDLRFRSPRQGKIRQDGWSGPEWIGLMTAYDRLFDFIAGNEEFAAAVGRFVPWVKGPADVIKLLDVYLIQAAVQDYHILVIRNAPLSTAALVLGPHDVSVPWIDLSQSVDRVHPLRGVWTDLYAAGHTRDGCTYVGAWACYAAGTCSELLSIAQGAERYRRIGGTPPFDFSDVGTYPKVAAACSSLFDGMIAGGYDLAVGDASGETNGGRKMISALDSQQRSVSPQNWRTVPVYRYARLKYEQDLARTAWRLTRDWRYAWLIRHVIGRTSETDAQWAEIEAACKGRRDPKLCQVSRVMGGLGMAILESGSESDDYRFKRALTLRTGCGSGHVHCDALDINLWAHGCRMATDHGSRCEGALWTSPPAAQSLCHNLVEIDSLDFEQSDAWVTAFKPLEGAQYVHGAAIGGSHPDVTVYQRDAALIDVDAGQSEPTVITPNAYVFDVFRVAGGKQHTWCFHGCDSDDLQTSAELIPADEAADKYLYRHLPTDRMQGTSGDVFEATWRLRREPKTIKTERGVVSLPNAERNMLELNYDENAPRKYTRVQLFGCGGRKVMVASPYSVAYNYAFPNVYVQSDADGEGRNELFPAIVEAYVDEPFITATELLLKEDDALGAAAIAVETRNGHKDVCFADGQVDGAVEVPGDIAVTGRFAYLSADDDGLRVMELVDGTALDTAMGSIRLDRRAWRGRIAEVDYSNLTLTLDVPWPTHLADEQIHIYNDDHHTYYHLVETAGGADGAVLSYDRAPDLGQSRILKVDGQAVQTEMPYRLETIPNRCKGLTATNEAHTAFWKSTTESYTVDAKLVPKGSKPPKVYRYRLDGPTPTLNTFADADGDGRQCLRMYDFGPGDRVDLPVHVQVRRTGANTYELTANAPCEVTLPAGAKLFISRLNVRAVLAAGRQLPEDPAGKLPHWIAPAGEAVEGKVVFRVTGDDLLAAGSEKPTE